MATTTARAAPSQRGDLRNYALVTAAYWVETLADGATRTLVLFYFYERGYSPFAVASLFLFYEFFGILTNLLGGWLAAMLGLQVTLFMGLATQAFALAMLGLAPHAWLIVAYVMVSQAFSGIAKDLTKMSSKSAVKLIVADGEERALYKWVSILTGSKNALKGVGFFLGGLLLTLFGFKVSAIALATTVLATLLLVSRALHGGGLGHPNKSAKFSQMFSNDRVVNVLAAARIFLFASRDVWFVVGLPVFLYSRLGWSFWQVGTFLAVWVIGYGAVQAAAPRFVGRGEQGQPNGRLATRLAFGLAALPAAIAIALTANLDPTAVVVAGLIIFGVVFALNSAVHSYLILAYSDGETVAMSVGFYYMANAAGRLAGTVLSGLLYEWDGLEGCLWASAAFVLGAGLLSMLLPASASVAIPPSLTRRAGRSLRTPGTGR